MASVEKTIKNELLLWPAINVNRLSVLHHLFCVIGNGFEWKDGELVETGLEDFKEATVEEAVKRVIAEELSIKELIGYVYLGICSSDKVSPFIEDEKIEILNNERNKVIGNINELISLIFRIDERQNDMSYPSHERYPYHTTEIYKDASITFYPLCEYSKLCNLPDDIKTDWLIAARDMYSFIVYNPQYIDEHNKKDYDEWLPKIKARLEELER